MGRRGGEGGRPGGGNLTEVEMLNKVLEKIEQDQGILEEAARHVKAAIKVLEDHNHNGMMEVQDV